MLRADCTVAFPTETVYGLGANALSDEAIGMYREINDKAAAYRGALMHVNVEYFHGI